MYTDLTSDQQDSPRCEHCNAPLAGRFSPCLSCRASPVGAFGARAAAASAVQLAMKRPQQALPVKLAARKIWRLSPRTSAIRYDSIDEAAFVPSGYRRLRGPLILCASALAVTSAVYLGFTHGNDERSNDPVAVSGKIQAQHGERSTTAATQKPGALVTQRPSRVVAAQRSVPAPSASSPALVAGASAAAPESTQRRVTLATSPATPRVAAAAVAALVASPVRAPVVAPVAAAVASTAASRVASPAASLPAPPPASPAASLPAPPPASLAASLPVPPIAPAALSQRSQPTPRSIATVTPDVKRVAVSQPLSPAEKLRIQASKHLRAARAKLQENDLSATKSRLAAAIAAQPDNRDAQRMRSAVNTREEQRDALLSLARGCGYVGQWACVSRNAGNALQIDASSKEAQRLVTRAMQESELQIAPPVEAAPESHTEARDLNTHH